MSPVEAGWGFASTLTAGQLWVIFAICVGLLLVMGWCIILGAAKTARRSDRVSEMNGWWKP